MIFDKKERDQIAHAAKVYLEGGAFEPLLRCGFNVYPFEGKLDRLQSLRDKVQNKNYALTARMILSWEVHCAEERYFASNAQRFG